MEYAVHTIQVAPRAIAAVRESTSLSKLASVIPGHLGEVFDFLRKNNVKTGRNVIVYFPTGSSPDGDIFFDAQFGVEVDGPVPASDRVVTAQTPGGTVAVSTHWGDYNGLPEAHRAIQTWCTGHGRKFAGTNWEVYGHWTGNQATAQTDVYYLLIP